VANLTEAVKKNKPYDLIVIDGLNMCFKYDHSLSYLNSIRGIKTGMFHGFFQMLLDLRIRNINARIVVAWEGGSLVRKQAIADYKDNRKKSSDSFNERCRKLKDMFGMMGVEQKYAPGYEADDVAATLCKGNNYKKLLITEDRDWYQIMDKLTTIRHHNKEMSYEQIESKQGFPPERYDIYQILKGKVGNNVVGIPYFPTELAKHIVRSCKYLGDIYKCRSENEKDKMWLDILKERRDDLSKRYNILRLKSDVDMEDSLCQRKNLSNLKRELVELQMFKVLKTLKRIHRLRKSQ